MKVEILKQEEKLAKCQAFCKKFECVDSKEKCIQEMEQLTRMKDQLAQTQIEEEKRALSAERSAANSATFPILTQVTAGAKQWDIIDSTLADEKYENDDERGLALEILLTKLSRGQ